MSSLVCPDVTWRLCSSKHFLWSSYGACSRSVPGLKVFIISFGKCCAAWPSKIYATCSMLVCVCGFVVFRIQIQKKDYWNRKLKRESNFTPKYNPHLSPYNFLFVLNLPPLCSAWLAILLHYLCLLHTSTYIIMIRSNCRQRWQLLDPKKSAVCKCFIMKVCKPRVQMTPPAKMLNRLPLSFKKFLIYRRRATSSEE